MEEVDEIHFHKSKKKGMMNFPIVMGGYRIHGKRGENEAIKILETLGFLKDWPWKYDPQFLMVAEKGKKRAATLSNHDFSLSIIL